MRAAARSSFDLLERTLAASRRLTPGQRLRHAGIVGRLRWRLARRWPTTAEVRLLFDHLPPAESRRCAGKIAAGAARDRWVVATLSQRGIDVLRPLVATADSFATLRPPAVLTAFHVGGWNALGPGLEALSAPVLSLRQDALYDPLAPPGDVDPVEAPDRWEKALASSTARWLETYLRSRPDQTGLGLLRTLATSPASTSSPPTAEDAEIAERS